MPEPDEPLPLLRRILPFMSVAILIALLYVGWIFYSRWNDSREADRARVDKEAEAARKTVDLLGGGQFKILNFYAVPGAISPGGRATVCFGVSGAKAVRMEPEVEPLKPALSRCLEVSPKRDTEYKLIAEDGKGHTATESFVLKVVR